LRLTTKTSSNKYYDERWILEDQQSTSPNQERVKLVVESVARHLRHYQNPRILDVGCGNGWILDAVSKRLGPTARLYGIDPSTTGIHNTMRRVPRAAVQCCAFESAAFDVQFDAVICSEVIEHVSSQVGLVSHIASLMGKESILVLTTPNGKYRYTYFNTCLVEPQPIEKWLTPDDLKCLLLRSFDSLRITTFDLSYWYRQNPGLERLRKGLWNFRGGWRLWYSIEGAFRFWGLRGLYVLAKAKRAINHG
jgi:2-polyprenyl-3-methyl-5-hydroxy-6-metoxy-1,4-benzoquinol methylase